MMTSFCYHTSKDLGSLPYITNYTVYVHCITT